MVDVNPAWINADAGAPEYDAAQLRRTEAVLMMGGVADRLGARPGVRPGVAPVSIVGTTVTVHNVAVVVYPGETDVSGPYRAALLETSYAVNAAEANPRKDILYVQVQDDDEDSSGQRRARAVYLAGTAAGSPVEPSAPAGTFRLATIDMPATGGGDPTVTFNGHFTVASGGLLPVRDDDELPDDGLYEGMAAWHQDDDNLIVWTGAAWAAVGSSKTPTQQRFTSPGATTWNKPAGMKWCVVEVQAGGGAGGGAPSTTSAQSSAGTGGQGGGYARTIFAASALASSETVTVGSGGSPVSGSAGGAGGTSSFGSGGTLVSASGGAGGSAVASSSAAGFLGGADASQTFTGQIQIAGGGGGPGGRGGTQGCISGTGGNSHLGHGGGGKGGPSVAGAAGKGYGGAGGGAANVLSSSAQAGGAGAPGIVIVTEYYA